MQINNYCPTKMSFPCSSWLLLSSKHIENQMINGFLERWQNDMDSLKEKLREEIREEKTQSTFLPFLSMIDSLFALSEKSSKEEYQLALKHIATWKQLSATNSPFTHLIERLEHLLRQMAMHLPPTSMQMSPFLEALEELTEILYPHERYKKVN